MELSNFYYITVLIIILFLAVGFSLNKKLGIVRNIKYIIPAIIISGSLFIVFGVRFAEFEIWKFNPHFNVNFLILNLPIEEWCYYIVLPYSGFLIYESVKVYNKRIANANIFVVISLVLLVVFVFTTYFNRQLIYTLMIFMFGTIYLAYTIFRNCFKKHLSSFYLSFVISLIPFFIIAGVSVALPFVEYDARHLLGLSVFTVPIENVAGFFLLFLMNITIYEYLAEKRLY